MFRAACLALTATAVAVAAMPIRNQLPGAQAVDEFNPRVATAMGYRAVPGGKLAHASCMHRVPSGAEAHRHPATGEWVYRDPRDANGAEVRVPKCNYPLIRRAMPQHGPAWIVDAVQNNAPGSFSYFAANFSVPPAPTNPDGVLLYYWPGTETDAMSDVVQPVLQYGVAGDGGGNYWIYASWFVSGDGTVLTSDPTDAIPVGTPLYGSIALSGANYVSTAVAPGVSGSPSVLSVAASEAQLQTRAYFTVEIYDIDTCDQTPPSNALAFTNIELIDGNGDSVQPNFTAETQNQKCGHAIQMAGDTVTITWKSTADKAHA